MVRTAVAAMALTTLTGACATGGPSVVPASTTPAAASATPSAASATSSATDGTGPSASALPSGKVLASARYHYELVYPTDWTATEVLGAGGVHPDEPGVDTYHGKRGYILSVVGQSGVSALTGWTCAIDEHLEVDHHLSADTNETLTIAGVPAEISSFHLVIAPYVIHYLTVKIVRAGEGLTLSLESTTKDADAADRLVLDGLLAGLSLT